MAQNPKTTKTQGDTRKEKLDDVRRIVSEPSAARDPNDCCPEDGIFDIRLRSNRSLEAKKSEHVPLNTVIRYQIEATGFEAYQAFMNQLMTLLDSDTGFLSDSVKKIREFTNTSDFSGLLTEHSDRPLIKLHGTLAYEVLRMATEAFLLTRCGPTCIDFRSDDDRNTSLETTIEKDAEWLEQDPEQYEARVLKYINQFVTASDQAATPYLQLIAKQLALNPGKGDPLTRLYASRYQCPLMIELIWSYWHEEGMLSQTMNAIGIRFQNRRSRAGNDPLANLEIDPLRPLNNLLWGWIQTEYRRLSVQRRAYEYDHHYGLTLMGKAVPPLLSADSRSKFLESFHTLLVVTQRYYDDASNTTIIPDGFPLLNELRGTHLILSEGAHNQYGDLPWTSRVEMLIEQWLLARPEMREFLRGRAMVPYQQMWMGQVDTMKKLQGWTDVTVTHFHELATCGEAILLSVRHGPWATNNNQANATAWADYWRPEIQRYMYAYKAVTGVDLTLEPTDNTVPARLLSQRLAQQQNIAQR
jgi:hypothetical protein